MSTIKMKMRTRISLALGLFFGLVAILTFVYGSIGVGMGGDSPYKFLLTLFGPTLALFTHMSILLFLPLCVPLVALLIVGAIYMQTRVAALVGFVATWLAVGWYLHDLF